MTSPCGYEPVRRIVLPVLVGAVLVVVGSLVMGRVW